MRDGIKRKMIWFVDSVGFVGVSGFNCNILFVRSDEEHDKEYKESGADPIECQASTKLLLLS